MTDDRTLYIGTDHALYRARPDADGRWRAEGLALAGFGGVRGLLIDPADPRRWWACTGANGVMVTRDMGITWQESNAGITRSAGWCLARHAGTGALWYGAEPTSIFRSADAAVSWGQCGGIDGLLEDPAPAGRVRHIGLGPGGLVLAAVEEGWLLRSEDDGATWVSVRNGLARDCHAISFVPGDPDIVIAATGRGVFRSEDGGRTFAPSDDGLRQGYVTQVVLHPDHPEVLFTAAAECDPATSALRPEGANAGFYRSDDGGRTWWRLTGGLPEVMRAAPTCAAGDPGDPDSLYVGTTEGSVWLSEDGGESFRIAVEGIRGSVRHVQLART